jgi:hypothetical protein
VVDAARESGNPNLRAIIFRQQFTQMTDIVDKTHRLYKAMGASYVGPPVWTWTFPSGAKIRLAYISADKDIWEYLGPRYSFIGFDESTFHSEFQIRNMLGRLSSTDRTLKLRMRLAPGQHWRSLAQDHVPPRGMSGSQSREISRGGETVLGRLLAVRRIPAGRRAGQRFLGVVYSWPIE